MFLRTYGYSRAPSAKRTEPASGLAGPSGNPAGSRDLRGPTNPVRRRKETIPGGGRFSGPRLGRSDFPLLFRNLVARHAVDSRRPRNRQYYFCIVQHTKLISALLSRAQLPSCRTSCSDRDSSGHTRIRDNFICHPRSPGSRVPSKRRSRKLFASFSNQCSRLPDKSDDDMFPLSCTALLPETFSSEQLQRARENSVSWSPKKLGSMEDVPISKRMTYRFMIVPARRDLRSCHLRCPV
jgi:hypothetical protein